MVRTRKSPANTSADVEATVAVVAVASSEPAAVVSATTTTTDSVSQEPVVDAAKPASKGKRGAKKQPAPVAADADTANNSTAEAVFFESVSMVVDAIASSSPSRIPDDTPIGVGLTAGNSVESVADNVSAAALCVQVRRKLSECIATTVRTKHAYTNLIKKYEGRIKRLERVVNRRKKRRLATNDDAANGQVGGSAEPKPVNGLTKPVLLSSQLALFLGLPEGSLMSRPEVTKRIHQYALDNHLRTNPKNQKEIMMDPQLSALFDSLNPEEPITYFSMQGPLTHHFIKPDPVSV